MNVAIIGATGFVGRAVVRRSLSRGWHVVAVARRASTAQSLAEFTDSRLVRVDGDISAPTQLLNLHGIDVAIYAVGGSKSIAVGRAAIEGLVDAIVRSNVRRIVLIGSLSVLDYSSRHHGAQIDEQSPLEDEISSRDEYAQIKHFEEQRARQWQSDSRGQLSILRLGAVVGPMRAWTSRLGFRIGGRWIQIDSSASVPIVHVDAAAEAVTNVVMASSPPDFLHVIHAIQPTPSEYLKAAVARGLLQPPMACVPARWARRAIQIGKVVSPITLNRFDARFMPVQFRVGPARAYMGDWVDQPLDAILDQCVENSAPPTRD